MTDAVNRIVRLEVGQSKAEPTRLTTEEKDILNNHN